MMSKSLKLVSILTAILLVGIFQVGLEAGIMDLLRTAFTKETPVGPPTIRVLLAHDQPGVILEVKGRYRIYDPRTSEQITSNFQGKRRLVQAMSDGLRWGEEFPGVHQIVIVPEDPTTTIIVDGVEYQGTIYVYDVGGSLSVVNKIDVEDYLNSVLPQRYAIPLQDELLAAIAVTARTDAYHSSHNSKTPYWDVDAQQVGYHGYALGKRSKDFERAIYKTQYIGLKRIGEGNWEETPFAVDWRPIGGGKLYHGVTYSIITVEDADKMAKMGRKASDILQKAFPKTRLELMYQAQG